jgi:hypothetical protein
MLGIIGVRWTTRKHLGHLFRSFGKDNLLTNVREGRRMKSLHKFRGSSMKKSKRLEYSPRRNLMDQDRGKQSYITVITGQSDI